MSEDLIRMLLDDDPGSRERRVAWMRSVTPDEAAALDRWESLEDALRLRVAEALPDRELLVLHALESTGRADALDERDRERLLAAGSSLEAAKTRLDAFDPMVRSIAADCAAFDEAWDEHLPPRPAPEPALLRVPDRRAAPDRRSLPASRPRRLAVRWLTAVVVAGFAISVALLAGRDADRLSLTAGDSVRIETLSDGSVVRLHPGSTLSFDPETARRVALVGRAFFDVIHDESPFTVSTDHATITVLGTTFGVSTTTAETEVVLVSGRVAASSTAHPDQLVVLEPGDRTVIRAGERSSSPEAVDVERSLEWTGLLIFRGTPMARVAGRLESAYGIDLVLDPALASESITGTFRPEQPIDQVVEALAETLGARATKDEDGTWRLRL